MNNLKKGVVIVIILLVAGVAFEYSRYLDALSKKDDERISDIGSASVFCSNTKLNAFVKNTSASCADLVSAGKPSNELNNSTWRFRGDYIVLYGGDTGPNPQRSIGVACDGLLYNYSIDNSTPNTVNQDNITILYLVARTGNGTGTYIDQAGRQRDVTFYSTSYDVYVFHNPGLQPIGKYRLDSPLAPFHITTYNDQPNSSQNLVQYLYPNISDWILSHIG